MRGLGGSGGTTMAGSGFAFPLSEKNNDVGDVDGKERKKVSEADKREER